jgi:hypothetical protein
LLQTRSKSDDNPYLIKDGERERIVVFILLTLLLVGVSFLTGSKGEIDVRQVITKQLADAANVNAARVERCELSLLHAGGAYNKQSSDASSSTSTSAEQRTEALVARATSLRYTLDERGGAVPLLASVWSGNAREAIGGARRVACAALGLTRVCVRGMPRRAGLSLGAASAGVVDDNDVRLWCADAAPLLVQAAANGAGNVDELQLFWCLSSQRRSWRAEVSCFRAGCFSGFR